MRAACLRPRSTEGAVMAIETDRLVNAGAVGREDNHGVQIERSPL